MRCQRCHLVYVPQAYHLPPELEMAEYELHQNSPADLGYRRFLSRLFEPMQARLTPHSCGLDFGCGPGPTLSIMFEEVGHQVALYDHFYAKDRTVFEQRYDFVTATEVVEHLRQPYQELVRLWACLKLGGILGLMTKLVLDREAFSHWHYKRDLTHICFFSRDTFQWLALHWQAQLTFIDRDVILLEKI